MDLKSGTYIIQQIGAIFLSAFLLYVLYQWFDRSRASEREVELSLQNAKAIRREAFRKSNELISRMGR